MLLMTFMTIIYDRTTGILLTLLVSYLRCSVDTLLNADDDVD